MTHLGHCLDGNNDVSGLEFNTGVSSTIDAKSCLPYDNRCSLESCAALNRWNLLEVAVETCQSQLWLKVTEPSLRFLQQATTTRFLLRSESGPKVVGRNHEADVFLPAESVSRRHALIEHDGAKWTIRDLESKAGTRVNRKLIAASEIEPLQSGDQIQLGPLVLIVRLSDDDDSIAGRLLGADGSTDQTMVVTRDSLGSVSAISEFELSGLAQHRLSVLLKSAASLTEAPDIPSLASAITRSAAVGTSSPRAFLIQSTQNDELIVWGKYPCEVCGAGVVEISRSLVALATSGKFAQLQSGDNDPSLEAKSIETLNIRSAICAPIFVDSEVVAVLYLDSRGSEKPIADDSGAFCVALSQLGGMALANLKRAELARQEKELRDELVAARLAQQQLMPDAQGQVGPIRYALESVPGTIVAGDVFDIIPVDDETTLVLLGDVMGKGAAAGLMMATVQTFLRARCQSHLDLPKLLHEANGYFHARFKGKGFVTLWIGMFHANSGRLTYVDAGHGHWCVLRRGQGAIGVESEGGPPIGAFKTASYDLGELEMPRGDRVILFSDGLVEQKDDQGRLFEEINDWLYLSSSGSVEEDVQLLHDIHASFRGQEPLSDDLTVASIELCG